MKLGRWIKILFISFLSFFLLNYGPFYFTKQEREWRKKKEEEKKAIAEYSAYINEIRYTFAKNMLEKLQLKPSGYGGTLHRKVEMLSMEFTAYRRASIQEARALQLIAMDQFVKTINAHEKIQPFLDKKPFTYKRIQIAIDFIGPTGEYCDESVTRIRNVLGIASNRKNRNKIFYSGIDPYNGNIVDLHDESYDEALKILKASPDLNPFNHEFTPLEMAMDPVQTFFVKEMEKKYHLECRTIGGKMPGRVEVIGANFNLVKHTSQEEARKLLLLVTERLLEILNQTQELKPFLIEYPFPSDRLKLRISFTESNHYSYFDGSMESITLEKNKITYFKIPPEDRLVRSIPFHEESYQEAQSIL